MGWQVVSFTVLRRHSTPAAAADATLTITLTPVPLGKLWRVEGIAVVCNSTSTSALLVYDQPPQPASVPCQATRSGNLTIDDQNSPLTILGGDQLVLVWENVSKGAIARCRVQFQVLQGLAGQAQPVAI